MPAILHMSPGPAEPRAAAATSDDSGGGHGAHQQRTRLADASGFLVVGWVTCLSTYSSAFQHSRGKGVSNCLGRMYVAYGILLGILAAN